MQGELAAAGDAGILYVVDMSGTVTLGVDVNREGEMYLPWGRDHDRGRGTVPRIPYSARYESVLGSCARDAEESSSDSFYDKSGRGPMDLKVAESSRAGRRREHELR